jgi:hypothetical protein
VIWILCTAALALIIKFYVLLTNSKHQWAGRQWISLVLSYGALNLSELLVYFSLWIDASPSWLIKAYFVAGVLCIAASFDYVRSGSIAWQRALNYAIYSSATVLCLIILFSDLIIGLYQVGSMPVKSTKGALFPVYVFYALSCIPLTFGTLIINYKNCKDASKRIDYAYTMIAFVPIALTIAVVLVLIAVGLNANGSMVVPIATTAFLMITVLGKISSDINLDPRNFVNPFGSRARRSRRVIRAQTQFLLGHQTYNDAMATIQSSLIDGLIDEHGGNISKASRESGIDRGLFYRKRSKSES